MRSDNRSESPFRNATASRCSGAAANCDRATPGAGATGDGKCFHVNAVTAGVRGGTVVALTDGKSKGKRHSTRAHPPRGGAAKPGISSTRGGEIVRLPKVSAEHSA